MSNLPRTHIAGKYEVERELGRGGMGFVVAARHLLLKRRVALKFLHLDQDQALNEVKIARFLREAELAAQLQSEHVVRVMDIATDPGSGVPFIEMEFLEGQDLDAVLSQRGRLPVSEAAGYVVQACDAIVEAHARGIVHRDLKPANLFLSSRKDGSALIKVLDFGISKNTVDHHNINLTADVVAMGTASYMSPEQFKSTKHVDHRTDIWAIGAILYELVTGQVPFGGTTRDEVLAAVLMQDPPSMQAIVPSVHEEFERVVRQCLEKSPEKRPPTIQAVVELLTPFLPPGMHALALQIMRQGAPMPAPRHSSPSIASTVADSILAYHSPSFASGTEVVPPQGPGATSGPVVLMPVPPSARHARQASRRPMTGWLLGGGIVLALVAGVALKASQYDRKEDHLDAAPLFSATAAATASPSVLLAPPPASEIRPVDVGSLPSAPVAPRASARRPAQAVPAPASPSPRSAPGATTRPRSDLPDER